MDIDKIKALSKGRWSGIYEQFGINVGTGKHIPCPACGGKDRFRCDNKNGMGEYICGQCGAGDGIDLIQKVKGMHFLDVMREIAEIVGEVEMDFKPKPKTDPRKALNDVWTSSVQLNHQATRYLHNRGLLIAPNNLRYCPECYEPETKKKLPAIVARIQNREGKPVSIHRTYLNGTNKADIAKPKKLMPGVEPLQGSAIRLFEPGDYFEKDQIGVAEGIETAIAAAQLFKIATWAVISTSIMVGWKPPEGIRKFVVFGDNDLNFSGQKAAYVLANKLYLDGYIVSVEIPPDPGDWNDFLLNERRISAVS